MMFAALLVQASAVAQPINLMGPYLVSGGAMATALGLAYRFGVFTGAFKEFKDTYEKDKAGHTPQAYVSRTEMEMLTKHLDTRFDEVSRQLAELRKIKLEGQGR